jgi:hypothetical protein
MSLMLRLETVELERWYSVAEVTQIVGWSEDVVRRWIQGGLIQAFVQPGTKNRRKRVYRSVHIQGCGLVRFIKAHLTGSVEEGGSIRFRSRAS